MDDLEYLEDKQPYKVSDLPEDQKDLEPPEGGVYLVIVNGSLRLQKHIHCDDTGMITPGDILLYEDDYGVDWGIAYGSTSEDFEFPEGERPSGRFVRVIHDDDFLHLEEIRKLEIQSLGICGERVKIHELPMKLLACDYRFDKSKVTFHFSAENRVDFRILVRDLASIFKCRIELHQVGVRDETRIFGGIGFCGRNLCCMSHLNKFEPISIKMARTQNLPLTPTKISGVCGRLLCCLHYEFPTYQEFMEGLPNIDDSRVIDGKMATVLMVSPLKRQVVVEYEDGKRETLSKDEYVSGKKRKEEENED
jgi:cell fate regulator YaaT (PSP1 superfamily)